MKIVDLPPEDYSGASGYSFGPWLELWLLTETGLAVRLQLGWIVQIGKGIAGKEKTFIELVSPFVTILPTRGESRLAFRARRAVQDVGERLRTSAG